MAKEMQPNEKRNETQKEQEVDPAMQEKQNVAVFKGGRTVANVMRIVFIALAMIAFIVLAFMLIGFLISDGPERIMGEKSILLVLFSAVVFLLLASLPFRSVVKEAAKNVRKRKK